MAKKEKKIDIKTLSLDELRHESDKAKEDLYKLRFRSATVPMKNPMEIRNLRRHIARLETQRNQRKPS